MKNSYLLYSVISLLLLYLIGIFSGLFRFFGNYFFWIDNFVREFMAIIYAPFWDKFFSVVTLFGDAKGLAGLGVVALAIFLFYRKRKLLIPFIITIIGTELFVILGKVFTDRIRPSGEEFSFPSNHAALALALYGFIAIATANSQLLATNKNKYYKWLVIGSLLLAITLVGFSRLYIGVHFFSDVLMGYIVAGLWLIVGVQYLKFKKKINC